MKWIKFARNTSLSALLLAISITAVAQVPNLIGKWEATSKVLLANGKINTVNWTISVKRQQGHFVIGNSNWNLTDESTFSQNNEPFIGVIDQAGHAMIFAETKQDTKMFARLDGLNTMVVNLAGAGKNAAVARAIFQRKPS